MTLGLVGWFGDPEKLGIVLVEGDNGPIVFVF
jgi:hypothetical protein